MIEINLLPEDLRKKEVPKLALPVVPILKTVSVIVAVFLLAQLVLMVFVMYKNIEMVALEKRAAHLRTETTAIAKMKSETASVSGRLNEVDGLIERKFLWTQILNAFSDSATKGIWLRSLSVAHGPLPMAGAAQGAAPKKGKEKSKDKEKEKDNDKEKDKDKDKGKDKEKDKEKGSEKETPQETFFISIDGSVMAPGEETAHVGKFIKELKNNAVLSSTFDRIELVNMKDRKIKEYDVYDFSIVCVFKKDRAPKP